MEGKITFGKREAVSLLLIFICNQLILGFPRNMAESAGNAGWILSIYVSIIALCLFLVISKLYSRFDGKDLLDIGEFVGGNIGRIIVGLIIVFDYAFIIAVKLREYAEDMKVISFTQSPISFIMLFFILGMVIGANFGIEPLARSATIAVPLIAIGFIIVVVGSVRSFELSNIMPILGTGPYDIFVGGLPRISVYSGVSALFLIPPFLKSHNNFKKSGVFAIIVSAVILTSGALAYLLVLPYPSSTNSILPFFELSRILSYGRFFQRIESVFLLIWSLTALIYLSIGLFFVVYVFKKAFGLKYHKPLILPFVIIISAFSLMPKSLMEILYLENNIVRNYAWTITFGMTLVLLTIATLIKRKKGRRRKKC